MGDEFEGKIKGVDLHGMWDEKGTGRNKVSKPLHCSGPLPVYIQGESRVSHEK